MFCFEMSRVEDIADHNTNGARNRWSLHKEEVRKKMKRKEMKEERVRNRKGMGKKGEHQRKCYTRKNSRLSSLKTLFLAIPVLFIYFDMVSDIIFKISCSPTK